MFDLDRPAKEEMESSTDRGSAIIGGSYLEAALEEALRRYLVHDKRVLDKILAPSGPLGAFESKINIAYLTGMITKDMHNDLLILKTIRNYFAHEVNGRSFEEDKPKGNINNLKKITLCIRIFEIVEKSTPSA